MEFTTRTPRTPEVGNAFSVLLAERVLRQADLLALPQDWAQLPLGHPSRRRTAYRPEHRLTAVLAGLACGLRGVAPGNTVLRPNTALQARLGGRFPDQGTVHRWLDEVSDAQAAAVRHHLHQVVRQHGHFWEVLWSADLLVVDVDGQGLIARGQRFERAAKGWLGEGVDRGYQRYVCYAGQTREVLDEFLAPGNKTLMSQLPEMLAGLDAVIPKEYRDRTVLRGDSHLGTIGNLQEIRRRRYHYVCPPQHWSAIKRLKARVQGKRGSWFTETDSAGRLHHVQFWVLRHWQLSGKSKRRTVRVRATVYCEHLPNDKCRWQVLLTDLKGRKGKQLWQWYHERGGTIEEYNDQAERAYHLEVIRTGNFAGLNVLHSLIGLCWNLTQWALETLRLPPVQAPGADRADWVAAVTLDLSAVLQRASHSGLQLYRAGPGQVLEVEDTVETAESVAWRRWLQQPVQLRLRLAG